MKKYLLLVGALLAPSTGHAAVTWATIPFSGTFGADAYGQYHPGDQFSGILRYNMIENPEPMTDIYQLRGDNTSISLHTKLGDFDTDNPYFTYFFGTGELDIANPRSQPLFGAEFDHIKADRDSLPTPAQLAGHRGTFDFTFRTGDDEFSGGTGSVTFAGNLVPTVPEPATWAMMIVGLGLGGAAARRRRQKVSTRVSFAL